MHNIPRLDQALWTLDHSTQVLKKSNLREFDITGDDERPELQIRWRYFDLIPTSASAAGRPIPYHHLTRNYRNIILTHFRCRYCRHLEHSFRILRKFK